MVHIYYCVVQWVLLNDCVFIKLLKGLADIISSLAVILFFVIVLGEEFVHKSCWCVYWTFTRGCFAKLLPLDRQAFDQVWQGQWINGTSV